MKAKLISMECNGCGAPLPEDLACEYCGRKHYFESAPIANTTVTGIFLSAGTLTTPVQNYYFTTGTTIDAGVQRWK